MKRPLIVWGSLLVLVGIAACLIAAASDTSQKKYLVRHKAWEGQKLRYAISLGGEGAWTPAQAGLSSGKMTTEFVFTLVEKAMRENGECTYDLVGESLKSSGEGTTGRFSVTATRESCKWELNEFKGKTQENANPITKDMSLTVGERGAVLYGTGLQNIALFFIVHVDPRFWGALTLAPEKEVGVGDEWQAAFDVDLPDSKGEPLKVNLKAKVTGWENYNGKRCLAGAAKADLDLKDTWVTFKNGDRAYINKGKYHAEGKVLWDVEKGLLCFADAQNTLLVGSDKPERRQFAGKARCTLKLLAAQ